MKKVLTIIGTRPEAIKMAILIQKLNAAAGIEHKLCITGQHREMVDDVLSFFEINADYDLQIMKPGQDLTDVTIGILSGLRNLFNEYRPDLVLVHGDTSTCMAATLASYYEKIQVGHVEAGLRTYNLQSPFPEEGNRLITDHLAAIHFVPTTKNKSNLLREGIREESILITGNTVIDSLIYASEKVSCFSESVPSAVTKLFSSHHKVLLVTGHRRENFGPGFLEICRALKTLSANLPDLNIVYPVHLNPNVQGPVHELLQNLPNVFLIAPLNYPDFVFAMKNCKGQDTIPKMVKMPKSLQTPINTSLIMDNGPSIDSALQKPEFLVNSYAFFPKLKKIA
ncbi:MAG: UDP-N-acetylglucosamine 2-epimerase (non-hydrolyzing), partial [Sphingobacteriales bacterium]